MSDVTTCTERNLRIAEKSEAYKRVASAGFHILKAQKRILEHDICGATCHLEQVMVWIRCVCGREEILSHVAHDYFSDCSMRRYYTDTGEIDAAAMVEDAGALDEEHLQMDGYTPVQIAEIRRAYA